MTSVPALPCNDDAAEAQINAVLQRLICLLAEQTAREQAANAPELKEPSDAASRPEED